MIYDFDDVLVEYLVSREGLRELVGTRIYPDFFPQDNPLPAIAYTLEEEKPDQTQSGSSRITKAVYLINAWAKTRREVDIVARHVLSALDSYSGALRDIPVMGSFYEGMNRERDPETGDYCASMRFTIIYRRRSKSWL